MRLFALSALYAAFASAHEMTEKEKADALKYPEFADDMTWWGYTWEPIELTTDDGYHLVTFRITGRVGHDVKADPDLNPVLMM